MAVQRRNADGRRARDQDGYTYWPAAGVGEVRRASERQLDRRLKSGKPGRPPKWRGAAGGVHECRKPESFRLSPNFPNFEFRISNFNFEFPNLPRIYREFTEIYRNLPRRTLLIGIWLGGQAVLGLLRRREDEYSLFSTGISSKCSNRVRSI